jgi:hypothetical protein
MEHKMMNDIVRNEPKPAMKMNIIGGEKSWKRFMPIIIIFSIIIAITGIALLVRGQWDPMFAMRMMMGSFFGIFGFFKVINLSAFAEAYSTYDILAKKSSNYAHAYPFIEIILSALYFTDTGGIYRDIFTFILMSIGIFGVAKKLMEKEEIPCACLGMVFKIPMTWVTLAEDGLMAIEALLMILLALRVL